MSCVMCHVSPVTCHVSPVTCHLSNVKQKKFKDKKKIMTFFYLKKIRKIGGASRWRVCYQRGLPRLVFINGAIPYEDLC